MNTEKLERLLKNSYKKETAYLTYQDKWSKQNPTYGQCEVTSLIVQKYFGGTIHCIKLDNGDTHYFNIVKGDIVDLTREQFDMENIKISYEENEVIDRENILKNESTKQIYNLLLKDIGIAKLDGNICVFGDSIVWGAWDKEKAGWVNRLAIDCQNSKDENIVYNLGIPSETTINLLKRINNECKHRNPNTIIISIGINDALYLKNIEKEQTDMDTFEKVIKEIINICKLYTKNILFIGLTRVNENYTVPISWNNNEIYFNKNIEKYNEKIRECCIESKISFLNVLDILEIEDLNVDGIHPNENGHKKLYKRIKEELNIIT